MPGKPYVTDQTVRVVFGGGGTHPQHILLIAPMGATWASLESLGPEGKSFFVSFPPYNEGVSN